MTTKKELLQDHGNSIIASAHLTNSSGVIIHYLDHSNDKILISFVTGDAIMSAHYVKLHHNGAFRIGPLYFNLSNFIRSTF